MATDILQCNNFHLKAPIDNSNEATFKNTNCRGSCNYDYPFVKSKMGKPKTTINQCYRMLKRFGIIY